MNKELEKLITDILCFTELATPGAMSFGEGIQHGEVKVGVKDWTRRNIFPLSYIGPVEPLFKRWLKEEGCIFMDATPRDVNGHWDVSLIREPDESWGDRALYQLTRCRRQPLHELRGQKTLGEYACECSIAVIMKDGSYQSARSTMFYVGKNANGFSRWASYNYSLFMIHSDAWNGDIATHNTHAQESEEDSMFVNVCLGYQFNRDYDWTVTVAVQNVGNPVLLATDSLGARCMFGDRAPTGDRRDALKHWVREHWRKCRKDPDLEAFVIQHLRGAEEFIWKGFNCTLRPSPYDLRFAQAQIAKREAMKHERKTMRVRNAQSAVG